ncbi:MAG: RHS repeat-associated core domain-containing protein [Verrucomicrobiota bacterium]
MKTLRKTLFAIAVILFTAQAHAVMYLARPYDPNMGRWMSRDPIGEEGGVNLYGFVGNDGVDKWDLLGLWTTDVHHRISEVLGQDILIKCKCCEVKVERWLNRGSDYADGVVLFFWRILSAQSARNDYQHAMTTPGMTAAEARKAFEQFVQKQTEDAKRLAHEAQTLDDSNKEKCAKLRSALFALGRAIHADADSMSPMHNFAEWPGVIGGLTQKGLIDFFHDIHVHQDGENMDVFNAHPEVMRKLSGKYDPLIKSLSKCDK